MKRMAWVLAASLVWATGVSAQASTSEEDYLRAVTDFFTVPAAEVDILRGRGLTVDELPVVLFVAGRAGVSAEALLALRRTGQSWTELLRRYGVGADALHVPIPDDADAGRLTDAYRDYRAASPGQWARLRLSDSDIVALVNVRLLSETLDLPPVEILRRAGASGSFSASYHSIIG